MELSSYVLAVRGRQKEVAEAIGAQPQLVGQWALKVRQVPDARCPAIEMATAGAVTCEDMRPDLTWRRIRDEGWPWHTEGKPLLDVFKEPQR